MPDSRKPESDERQDALEMPPATHAAGARRPRADDDQPAATGADARAAEALAAFGRRVDAFARKIAALQRRAAALRGRTAETAADRAADRRDDPLDESFAAALEALQVAEAEVLRQQRELTDARLALERERARYEELFALAPDAYVVTGADGQIVEANRAAAELLRVPPAALASEPLPLYVAEEDRAAIRALLDGSGGADRVGERMLHVTPRGGGVVPVAATAAVARDSGTGAVVGVRWLLRDVSERVRADDALRRLNSELDARVAERAGELEARTRELEARTRELEERTRELEERGRELAARTADAEDARRRAEAADRAKSEFLATMSHELRTPINAMVGYTQLLDMGIAGPVTEGQRDYLGRLATSSEHLLALINDVLDLARVDAGRMPVTREAGWTARVVEAGLALTLPQAEAKGVRLVDARGSEPGVAYVGDEGRVRQILVNLLSNAVKFTPAGGTVTVSSGIAREPPAGARLSGGPWAFLCVADTGVGIAPEHQTAVFEPFTQVEQVEEVEGRGRGPYRRTQGGTGLGLTVSRRLARLMGGDLTLESAAGRGATFTLWLPSPAAGEGPAEMTGEQPAAERTVERSGERGARAGRGTDRHPAQGLGEIGEHLRERADVVVESFGARLRREPSIPQAAALRRADVEDHQLAFLADIAQSLVVIEESGGLASDLLRDGGTIQRVIAELHGRTRQRQGWTEEQLAREYAILGEELDALVRRQAPNGTGDASTALEVLHRFLSRAAATARRALRHAATHRETP